LFQEMFGVIFKSLARIEVPDLPETRDDVDADWNALAGRYANLNQVLEFKPHRDGLQVGVIPNGASSTDRYMKLAFIDRDTARPATGDVMWDRNIIKFSDYVDGEPGYAALGLRQYKRVGPA
jgi:hypothetical protein